MQVLKISRFNLKIQDTLDYYFLTFECIKVIEWVTSELTELSVQPTYKAQHLAYIFRKDKLSGFGQGKNGT